MVQTTGKTIVAASKHTWYSTSNKSQGLTISRAVLNLNRRENCVGLSYVAVSRVKVLDGVLFEVPFDFDHFTRVDSVVSQERELDYTFRNTQLL
ncbi:hypothetical protein F5882DRAFT_418847 [Hyaloscypha sp. PMI_1271]|nr:hypothetical protein F5882DRAFT_418847 [Hyaloscypha sp. PMI_1271]